MDLQYIVDAALPTWKRRITDLRASCSDASTFVAVAVDTGARVHAEVAADLDAARALIDAVASGLATSILDDPARPPLPMAVCILRASGRVVAWSHHPLDFGAPS